MAPQALQPVQKAPSLKELGYVARRYTPVDEDLAIYIVKQPFCREYMAVIAIAKDGENASSTIFVHFVDMTIDSRGEKQRPRLRQMLAAFWKDAVGRSLQQLRRILFHNVTENCTRSIIRERVSCLMGIGYSQLLERPYQDIILNAPKSSSCRHLAEAWSLICTQSKLVRSVNGLLREFFTANADEELGAVQIAIKPAFDQLGNAHNFDLEVILGPRVHQETVNIVS